MREPNELLFINYIPEKVNLYRGHKRAYPYYENGSQTNAIHTQKIKPYKEHITDQEKRQHKELGSTASLYSPEKGRSLHRSGTGGYFLEPSAVKNGIFVSAGSILCSSDKDGWLISSLTWLIPYNLFHM